LFDVILMDVQMPRMNGMEATQLIRAELDLADQPTIIAMSADTTPRCQQNCLLAGMDGHIGKPVRIEDLDTALGFVFQRHGKPEVRHPCSQDGPPADAAVAAAVYDAHVLESLLLDLGGDGAMGADLIEWFILDCGKRLTAIVAAGHAADPEALAFQAHAIRSASATIGLLALSEVAGEIESAAKAAPAEVDVAWAASLLAAECHRATKALNANLPADVEEQDAKPGIEHLW
jgi:CheY-like chemotaxis protein